MGYKHPNGKVVKNWNRAKFPRTAKAFKKLAEIPKIMGMHASYLKSGRYLASIGDALMK